MDQNRDNSGVCPNKKQSARPPFYYSTSKINMYSLLQCNGHIGWMARHSRMMSMTLYRIQDDGKTRFTSSSMLPQTKNCCRCTPSARPIRLMIHMYVWSGLYIIHRRRSIPSTRSKYLLERNIHKYELPLFFCCCFFAYRPMNFPI